MRLQKLALKVVLVLGFLIGVYVVDLVLDFIWPSSNIPDWILWGGCNRIRTSCDLDRKREGRLELRFSIDQISIKPIHSRT